MSGRMKLTQLLPHKGNWPTYIILRCDLQSQHLWTGFWIDTIFHNHFSQNNSCMCFGRMRFPSVETSKTFIVEANKC